MEGRIAALPYDVVSGKEAREETAREPYSFLAVDRPETQLEEGTDAAPEQLYERAGALLRRWMKEGSLQKEAEPCYYIYELERLGHVQTGDRSLRVRGRLLKRRDPETREHENGKEEDRTPACEGLRGADRPGLSRLPRGAKDPGDHGAVQEGTCLYDFVSPDGIAHRVWRISGKEDCLAVHEAFGRVKRLYIADGHHRCASAARVAQECRRECPDYTGEEPFNFILSVLFPDDQLTILEYNRVIRDLNGLTPEEFLDRIRDSFAVCPEEGPYRPERKGLFGLYLGKTVVTA